MKFQKEFSHINSFLKGFFNKFYFFKKMQIKEKIPRTSFR